VTVTMSEYRCPTDGSPRLSDAGDDQKSASVEEDQVGPPPPGFSLYPARPFVSIGRSPARLAGPLFVPAFASSIAAVAKGSDERSAVGRERQTDFRSARRSASASTTRCCNRPSRPPLKAAAPTWSLGPQSTEAGAPVSASASTPSGHCGGTPDTSALLNPPTNAQGLRPSGRCGLPARMRSLPGVSAPIVPDSPRVS
jgi:hypothetical protein